MASHLYPSCAQKATVFNNNCAFDLEGIKGGKCKRLLFDILSDNRHPSQDLKNESLQKQFSIIPNLSQKPSQKKPQCESYVLCNFNCDLVLANQEQVPSVSLYIQLKSKTINYLWPLITPGNNTFFIRQSYIYAILPH